MVEQSLPVDLRRDRIAALVQERGFVRVAELSRIFRTSPVTIRTDLEELDARNAVRRVHGGAVSGTGLDARAHAPAETADVGRRVRIGSAAAGVISAGQTVVIAGATVTRTIGLALARRKDLEGVIVITNDLALVLDLKLVVPRFTVVVTGGTLRPASSELGDPLGGLIFEDLSADVSIVGCAGISADRGLMGPGLKNLEMDRRLVRSGATVVVAAEGGQVGAVGPARLAAAEDVDLLITGADAPPDELARLRDRGVDVKVVD